MTAPAAAERFLARLHLTEKAITFTAFSVMVVVVFADVLIRELTGSGLHWARQVGVYANIFVVMIGFGLASADGAHLRPRFADSWLPARWERFMPHVQEGLMALFCLGFTIAAVFVVVETWQLAERSVILRVVVWPVQAVIPLAFVLATIRHALYAIWPSLRPSPPQLGATLAAGNTAAVATLADRAAGDTAKENPADRERRD